MCNVQYNPLYRVWSENDNDRENEKSTDEILNMKFVPIVILLRKSDGTYITSIYRLIIRKDTIVNQKKK